MKNILIIKSKHTIIFVSCYIVFIIFVVLGAVRHNLWYDEAQIANFGRNVVRFGIPTAWDGVNILSFHQDRVIDKHLLNNTLWMEIYLTATSFAVFGISSFSARIPFVLFGLCSFFVVYFTGKKLFSDSRIAFLAVVILSVSVPYILYTYQARYYIVSVVFNILFLLSAFKIHTGRNQFVLLFIISGTLSVYSNFLTFPFIFISVYCSELVCFIRRKSSYKAIFNFTKRYTILGSVIAIFFSVWLFSFKPYSGRGLITLPTVWDFIDSFPHLIFIIFKPYIENNALPYGCLILILLLFLFRKKKLIDVEPIIQIGLFLFFYIILIALGTSITVYSSSDFNLVDSRYHTIFFVLFAYICAWIFINILSWKKILFYILVVPFLFTNLYVFQPFRVYIYEYFHELIFPPMSPDVQVAQFLKKYAKENDTVFVNLERNHEPLIFLLDRRFRFVNRFPLTDKRIFPDNRSILPRYIYDFTGSPDWVIFYGKNAQKYFDYRGKYLPSDIDLAKEYKEYILPVYFLDESRPELEYHRFKAVNPIFNDQIFIYQKIL